MRRRGRVDDNQAAIVKELRQIPGFSVAVTSSLGGGFGDIVVGLRKFNGIYEIKDPAKEPARRKLTKDEETFHKAWFGHIEVVETTAEIVRDMRIRAFRLTPQ